MTAEVEELAAEFDLAEPIAIAARYNNAPTQSVPVIHRRVQRNGQVVHVLAAWIEEESIDTEFLPSISMDFR